MKRKPIRFAVLAMVIICFIALLLSLLYKAFENQASVLPDLEPSMTFAALVPSIGPTDAAELTLIAQFTANPSFAVSSTPYFVEIIANDFIRRATTTPGLFSPPVIGMMTVRDAIQQLTDQLEAKGLDVSVDISSSGVEGINDTDLAEFQAYSSYMQVWVFSSDVEDEPLAQQLAEILATLSEDQGRFSYVNFNLMNIDVTFDSSKMTKTIHTSFDVVKAAQKANLEGIPLIEALGGFTTFAK